MQFLCWQERIQLETSRLYKQAGVNPLAGSLILKLCYLAAYGCCCYETSLVRFVKDFMYHDCDGMHPLLSYSVVRVILW